MTLFFLTAIIFILTIRGLLAGELYLSRKMVLHDTAARVSSAIIFISLMFLNGGVHDIIFAGIGFVFAIIIGIYIERKAVQEEKNFFIDIK